MDHQFLHHRLSCDFFSVSLSWYCCSVSCQSNKHGNTNLSKEQLCALASTLQGNVSTVQFELFRFWHCQMSLLFEASVFTVQFKQNEWVGLPKILFSQCLYCLGMQEPDVSIVQFKRNELVSQIGMQVPDVSTVQFDKICGRYTSRDLFQLCLILVIICGWIYSLIDSSLQLQDVSVCLIADYVIFLHKKILWTHKQVCSVYFIP